MTLPEPLPVVPHSLNQGALGSSWELGGKAPQLRTSYFSAKGLPAGSGITGVTVCRAAGQAMPSLPLMDCTTTG